MDKKLEYKYTDNVVCPYCGYVHEDSWEYGQDGGNMECSECGKTFDWECHIQVSYSTSRKKCAECKPVVREGHSVYIYEDKNWTVYQCPECLHDTIKTGPVIDNTPYVVPLDAKNL
jgi:transposase